MSITFGHPYASPTLTLTLRNPELGDADQLNLKTQFHITMDGGVASYINTPTDNKLLLNFSFIKKADLELTMAFLIASAGTEVKFTDWNSVIWRGHLLTDPLEAVTYGNMGGSCVEVSKFTLEFEGVKI